MTTPALLPQAEATTSGMVNSAVGLAVERPLDIALVHAADHGGGAERSVLTLHQTLRRLGHRSRLFVGEKKTDEPDVYQIRRERSIPGVLRITRWLENGMGWQNLYAPWFRELHRQIGAADLLHIHTLWGGTFGYSDLTGVVRLSRRYPTVMTLRDGFMLTGHCACPTQCERWQTGCGRCPDLKRVPAIPRDATALNWRRKLNAIQRSPLHVTTVSHWLKTQVEQSPIFTGKPVSVVHNSIDETVFYPDSQPSARAELGLPADAFLVLLAGQSVEGIHQGISQQGVFALNQLGNADITALLVGHSAPLVAATLSGPSVVRPFQTAPEDMARYYRAADVTLVCSEYETFGRVAAEAIYCGTPVIAFATGGLTDIVVQDVTGWLVPTGDVDGLVQALDSAFRRRSTLHEFGQQASRWAANQFSMDLIAHQYLDVYRRTLQRRSHGVLSSRRLSSGTRPMRISTIIPAFNCEPYLRRAVESLLATQYPDLEIVIVDDGSRDKTLAVAETLQREHPQVLRVVTHPGGRNRGVSATRNLGIESSTGEWLSSLDADDYVYPQRFDSARAILSEQSDVDGVYQLSEVVFADEQARQGWWDDQTAFGFTQAIPPERLIFELLRGYCWATSAIVFRRSLLAKTGLFDPRLKLAEDCHLWFRMAVSGKLIAGDLQRPVSAYWRHGASAYQPSPALRLNMIRAMSSFERWLRVARPRDPQLPAISRSIADYILNGVSAARTNGQHQLAWSIALKSAGMFPQLTSYRRWYGHLARMTLGR